MTELNRGDVWWVSLDPAVGSETKKTRPCVIVQRDMPSISPPTTIVCPLTDARSREANILNVLVRAPDGGLAKDSIVSCSQIRVVDRARVGNRLGHLSADTMNAIDRGLRSILDL